MTEDTTRRRFIAVGGGTFTIAIAGCTGVEDDDEGEEETVVDSGDENGDVEEDTDEDGNEDGENDEEVDEDQEFADPERFEVVEMHHDGEEHDIDRVEVVNNHEELPIDLSGWTFETEITSVTIPDGAVLEPGQSGFVELVGENDNALEPDGGVFTVRTTDGELVVETEYPPAADEEEDEPTDAEFVDEVDGQIELTYGETAVLSNGVEVTGHGVETFDELSDEEPEERDQFALLKLEAENTADEANELPSRTHPDVYLLFEDQQIESTINSAAFRDEEFNQYDGDEVQGGVNREGYILYEVDDGLTESDIDFLWQDEIFVTGDLDGDADVLWTAE